MNLDYTNDKANEPHNLCVNLDTGNLYIVPALTATQTHGQLILAEFDNVVLALRALLLAISNEIGKSQNRIKRLSYQKDNVVRAMRNIGENI